jgi:serine beta-lactamase-like protein LACTB
MKKIQYLILAITLFVSINGFSQNKYQKEIKKANRTAKKFLNSQRIPGMSISVSKNNELIWSQGFGYADIKNKKKVISDTTLFRIASISKTLTAVALAKLVEENKMDFDASLYDYVPDFPKKKYDFTIRQTAAHLAGIRHYNGKEFSLNKKMSIVEGLDIFKNSPLLFKPGTRYSYSTYGWNLLSVAIQNTSGISYTNYMEERIFNPLKMSNTHLDTSDKEIKNTTKFYLKRKEKITFATTVSNEFKAAGGGFLSTSEDLILFGNEFIHPTLITENSLSELVTPLKPIMGKSNNYGIGIKISKTKKKNVRYSHSGGGVGATTYLLIYPEKEMVITILTNLSGVKMLKFTRDLERIFVD